jgi:aryl-alcohol dehydrogenase-like predicted oxidoreductase
VIATKVALGSGKNSLMLIYIFKYTTNYQRGNDAIRQKISYTGNNIKSMHLSVEASLKKLRTSYIDILYVHWWDWDTSVEEVMNGLHVLVQQGKVLYLVSVSVSMLTPTFVNMYRWQGISDSPAWVVSKANQYARDHGKSPFVIYQGAWNVMLRDFEREIIPMARSEGRSILFLAIWCLSSRSPMHRSCTCPLECPCRWKNPNR